MAGVTGGPSGFAWFVGIALLVAVYVVALLLIMYHELVIKRRASERQNKT